MGNPAREEDTCRSPPTGTCRVESTWPIAASDHHHAPVTLVTGWGAPPVPQIADVHPDKCNGANADANGGRAIAAALHLGYGPSRSCGARNRGWSCRLCGWPGALLRGQRDHSVAPGRVRRRCDIIWSAETAPSTPSSRLRSLVSRRWPMSDRIARRTALRCSRAVRVGLGDSGKLASCVHLRSDFPPAVKVMRHGTWSTSARLMS